ncbi:hypothetical protein [Parasphingorhabdus sp. NYA22]
MMKNIIIVIVGLAIMLASALTALGAITKTRAPEIGTLLLPLNGFASEKLASNNLRAMIIANQAQFPETISPDLAKLAKQAFLAEPITPDAIAVFAFDSDDRIKRKLMNQAFALSRRQQLVSGWMIADSGDRNDVPAVLDHYDTMLRTTTSANAAIILLLAKAIENDEFVEPFADLLSEKPRWAVQFWTTVVATPEVLENAARLRELIYTAGETDHLSTDALLISALVRDKQFETGRKLYQTLNEPEKPTPGSENSSFEHEPRYPPFDWMLYSTGQYGAVITDGALRLNATPNSGGLFARKLVLMPARIIEIEVKTRDIPDDAFVDISLTCAETVDNAPRPASIPVRGKLTKQKISNVQSGCGFYWLDINARATDRGGGLDVSFDSVSLQFD